MTGYHDEILHRVNSLHPVKYQTLTLSATALTGSWIFLANIHMVAGIQLYEVISLA